MVWYSIKAGGKREGEEKMLLPFSLCRAGLWQKGKGSGIPKHEHEVGFVAVVATPPLAVALWNLKRT